MKNNTIINKDLANKTLSVTREFSAPVDKVWRAWTEAELLDKWWAPRPWKTETQSMDFKPGGLWFYAMVGPVGERHYSRVDFTSITPKQSFTNICTFCNAEGNVADPASPKMYWKVEFMPAGAGTRIETILTFDELAGLEKIVAMGFEGGFSMALGNLDELLAE